VTDQEPKPQRSYYVYCVIAGEEHKDFGHIGIGGSANEVHTVSHKDIRAVVSQTAAESYERNEENILAHQQTVQRIFQEHVGIPMPFSTIFKDKDEVIKMLESRYAEFKERLAALASFELNRGGEAAARDPARKLIEGALAQSFASALRIRQLNEEVSRLRSAGQIASSPGSSRLEEEVRLLREQVGNLRSMQEDTKNLLDTVRSLLHEFRKAQEEAGTSQKPESSGQHNSGSASILGQRIRKSKHGTPE